MFDRSLRKAWIVALLCIATVASADAGGPRAGFKTNPEDTFISPDKTIRLEQYSKVSDDRALYQFWTFDKDHRHAFLLNPGETDDFAGYAAGFLALAGRFPVTELTVGTDPA